MKKLSEFTGTGVAIITPFDAHGKPDTYALSHLVSHLAENGIDFIVVMGTTGESVSLNEDEQALVKETVVTANAGRCALMLGLGGNNTAELERKLSRTDFSGYQGILSVSPYYNKPSQEGIFRHYEVLASASPLPIMLYNVPGRTGSNMLADTTLRLSAISNIMGIKEASGNMDQISTIIRDKPQHFTVLSGDDALTLPILASGGDGVISVVANAFPKMFSLIVRRCMSNDVAAALPLHLDLLEFTRLLFADGNPGGIKAALKILGLCGEHVRLPLVNVKPELYQQLVLETERLNQRSISLN
jgi:4-hydroxy-tetrahydrodipicolinate synthase